MLPSFTEIPELAGKTITRAQVYKNVVMFELSDGKTGIEMHLEGDELRVHVVSQGPKGAPPGVRVYRSDFARAKLPSDELK